MKTTLLSLVTILVFLTTFSVKAQEITMFAGFWDNQYYQDDKRISRKDLKHLLEKDVVAIEHWNKAKTYQTLSWVALGAEVGFGVWGLANLSDNKVRKNSNIGMLGSLTGVITFALISHHQKKKAILKYNQGLDDKTSFKIMPSRQGFGIVMEF